MINFFCLNMEPATNRKAHCQNEFTNAGIEVQFVKAFNARRNNTQHVQKEYKAPALGCYLSHLRLLEEIERYNYGVTVIFEDDVLLVDGFNHKLIEVTGTLPAQWDIAFIGWRPEYDNHGKVKKKPVTPHWQKITLGKTWGTYGYMVNGRAGAESLLQVLQPITEHIDIAMNNAIVQARIKGYYLIEPIVNHNFLFKSQIQSEK